MDSRNQKCKKEWDKYFEQTKINQPSDIAMDALKEFNNYKGLVIDLGCGAGKDSLYYLKIGWRVVAIDENAEYISKVREGLPEEIKNRFEIRNMSFEKLKLSKSDCIIANYSLPFCKPIYFKQMWLEIVSSINKGGIFSGVFFGNKDQWAESFFNERTFHTKDQIINMFANFKILKLEENEFEGKCRGSNGEILPKNWHVFKVVAQKY